MKFFKTINKAEKRNGKFNRKKIMPAILVFMIIFLAASVTESIIYFRYSKVDAAGSVVSADGKFVIPECNADSEKGSKDNPFVVLEIVPGASSASFGYLVGGQEPIDIERALKEDPSAKDVLSKYVNINEDGTYTNTDLFKKLGIGLAYIDNDIANGEDISRFEFGGWFLEEQCVNRVKPDMKITKDTTVYAKWISIYPTDEVNISAGKKETYKPQYTMKFDANCGEEQDGVIGMPEDITHIEEYSMLVEPISVPRLKDKLFAGWYTEKECTNRYSFNKRVGSDVTLYAKWADLPETRYNLYFNSNAPAGIDADSVNGMPETIENYAKNGMAYNGEGGSVTDAAPKSEPAVSGYSFTGWYYDSACTRPFDFARPVPDDIAAGDVALYAGWAKEGAAAYTLMFDVNEPSDAISKAEFYKESLEADASGKVNGLEEALGKKPVLEGNIEKKVKNYNVKVITTTPEDFFEEGYEFVQSNGGTSTVYAKNKYGEHNLQLIDRADMIYISEAYHDQLTAQKQDAGRQLMDLFVKYKNKDMWYDRGYMDENNPPPKDDPHRLYRREPVFLGMYNGESSIDFDWRTTMRLFKKNTVGSKGDGTDAVPVIYDLKSIGSKLPNGDTSLNMDPPTQDAEFTTSDGKHVNLNTNEYLGKASQRNTYKLYLMLIQMDPVTIYNAYIDGQSRYGKICVEGEHAGCFEYYDAEKDIHVYTDRWTYNTLMPVESVSSDVWEEYTKDNNCYYWKREQQKDENGVVDPSDKTGISDSLGYNDYPKLDSSAVYYNSLATDTVNSSLVLELLNKSTVTPDEGMKDFIPKEVADSEGYNMTNALYYLLNGDGAPKKYEDDVRVLDIEPSDGEGSHKDSSFWFWYISKYMRNFSGKVNVTETTTWEFAGNIDDLNSEYDLIYIGGNISAMDDKLKDMMPGHDVKINEWQTENRKYVYSHNGAVMDNVELTNRGGTLGDTTADSAVTKFIASGNDLTKIKYNDILRFAEAGYPIVFGTEMVNSIVIKGKLSAKDINTDSIDSASYVYRLMHTLVTGKNSDGTDKYRSAVFSENENDNSRKDDFVKALTTNKFSVKISKMPTEYVDRTLTKYSGYVDKDVYVNGDDINNKSLEYKLKIENDKGGKNDETKKYTLNIYIDTNADGRYDDNEKLDALDIRDVTDGKSVKYNNLTGGHTFTVSREIDNYAGAIPWMIEITDNSNNLVRKSITGQCAVKVADKTRLNVLQIVTNDTSAYFKNNVYLPTDEEISKAYEKNGPVTIANMRTYFEDSIEPINILRDDITTYPEEFQQLARTEMENVLANSGMFHYYASILEEFDVHFTRLTVAEFEQKVAEQNEANAGKDEFGQTNIMDNYNMIILGYADCYSDVNDEACKVIDTYIEEGNTTLFTHDTTSYVNLDTEEFDAANTKAGVEAKYWGYNINRYFRKIVGMDRYNVTDNKGDKSRIDVSDDSYDKPYKTGTEQNDNVFEETNTGKALNQGMTNVTLTCSEYVYPDKVTKTNEGQIVSYPYYIPDQINVADTHAQYYQLNLDEDDIVVWYCIGQSNDNEWCYSQKNDVRNNYYIYNKGNITYSGAGHSSGMTEDEVRLFINTMIAAYSAGVAPPQPVITNSDKSTDNKDTDFVYIDYDATVSPEDSKPFGSGVFDKTVDAYTGGKKDVKTKRIFFKVDNNSIVMNKEMTVHYFPAVHDDSGNIRLLSSFPLPLKTYRIDDDTKKYSKDHAGATEVNRISVSVPQKVVAGGTDNTKRTLTGGIVETEEEYYVDVPISDNYYEGITYGDADKPFGALDNRNEFAIQIQVIMRYGKDKNTKIPLRGYRNMFIMRRGMFSLD
ncbi:MAG: DUF5057 domain-containing protein [Lachnospiraceae bacterium]|nr:DUF5057 domain-containing protein [Lachnospiraceae bacterium]